jgi:uncharacterized membrane protein
MMVSDGTSVLGIEIPSTSPFFLGTVGFHVLVGLTSVIAGAGAMFSDKGTSLHLKFCKTYYWCLSAVFASASALAIARWAEDSHLFILGVLSFAAASFGRTALRQRWPNSVRLHISAMGVSYIVLLTAFYVDNGMSLPFWKELPLIAYWLLPSAAGIPLILRSLLSHPLARRSGSSR